MFKFIRLKSREVSLCHLDRLFGQTISKLPVKEQIAYCQRLIERSEYQLSQHCPKKDSEQLKDLISAATMEIQRLDSR
ncbi:hypothetical protein AB1A65_10290 [Muricauda sp. ANG21]|jgi:hypothetical protein|uniref:hypothetical protein n=1 Tax=Allomuricauda sp. ANG21 TaxID=3042468 RepID=UPI003452D10A